MNENFGRLGMTDFEKRLVHEADRDELRKGIFSALGRGGARIAQAMTPQERSARSKKGAASRKMGGGGGFHPLATHRSKVRSKNMARALAGAKSTWAAQDKDKYESSGQKELDDFRREQARAAQRTQAAGAAAKKTADKDAWEKHRATRDAEDLAAYHRNVAERLASSARDDARKKVLAPGAGKKPLVRKSDQPGGGDVHVDGPMPDFPKKTKKKQANPASMDVEKGNGLGVPVAPPKPRPKKAVSGPRPGAKRVEEDEVPMKSPGGAGLSDYKGDGSGSASYKDGSSFDGRGWQADKGSGPRSPRKQGQLGYVKN